jgi:thiamine pyrophosphate-dependent acetolactate synthase large subunit-like protein
MYGPGAYQSADLAETDYAAIARAMGCAVYRVANPASSRPPSRRPSPTATARPSSTCR